MNIFQFPNQRIPERKKNKQWHIDHIQNFIDFSNSSAYIKKKSEMLELYYAEAAKLSKKKKQIVDEMVTQCYGQHLGPKYDVYPLIESQIEQLLGQYRDRPLRRRAMVKNQEAIIRKLDEKSSMYAEKFVRQANEELSEQMGFQIESENQGVDIPEDIEDWFNNSYRTISEQVTEDILHQLLVVRKGKEDIINMLYHYLVVEECWGLFDKKDGHPRLYPVHPLDCFADYNPNENIQSDMNYFIYDKYMSINDIFNQFEIKEEDKSLIENYAGIASQEAKGVFQKTFNVKDWFDQATGVTRVRVVSMLWVSKRKINFKSFVNKNTNEEELKILPDEYKMRKKDNAVSIEVDDVRHITMVGPSVVLSYGALEDDLQLKSLGDEKKRFLPVIGLSGKVNNHIRGIRSLAKKLEWLQDFASDIIYQIKLSTRQMDGNVIVYDLSSIPKQFKKEGSADAALKRVNYHLRRDQIMYINSKDKRTGAYASSINLSQSKRINDLLVLLAAIEELASKISGVNENMQGQNKDYSKASVAEMKLAQASARVENYFGIFDSYTDIALTRMCSYAKNIYEENQIFSYFAGDGSMKFLKIYPEFFIDDIGIYLGDNRKEYKTKQIIDQIASETFSQTQYPEMLLSLLKIMSADTSRDAEIQLQKGIQTYNELKQQAEERESEQQNQMIQAQQEGEAQERDLRREGFQKDIVVANIYADSEAKKNMDNIDASATETAAQIEKEILLGMTKELQNRDRQNQESDQASMDELNIM